MKLELSPIANGIVSACALTGLGLLLGRGFARVSGPAPPAGAESAVERVEDWAALVAGGTSIGDAAAPAVLLTFSDFQCPYCGELARLVGELRRENPSALRMVYRHFPLTSIHPHAEAAALAAECAAEQGRFEAMHDALYERQDRISAGAWQDFASAAAVPDTASFARCMAETRYAARVHADVEAGDALGVTGTPTVYLNGKRLQSGLSKEAIRRSIARAAEG